MFVYDPVFRRICEGLAGKSEGHCKVHQLIIVKAVQKSGHKPRRYLIVRHFFPHNRIYKSMKFLTGVFSAVPLLFDEPDPVE